MTNAALAVTGEPVTAVGVGVEIVVRHRRPSAQSLGVAGVEDRLARAGVHQARGHQAGGVGAGPIIRARAPAAADDGELERLAGTHGAAEQAEPRDRRDRQAAHRVEAEQLGPPADRGGVEVGQAPDAAVDVLAAGRSAIGRK